MILKLKGENGFNYKFGREGFGFSLTLLSPLHNREPVELYSLVLTLTTS